MLNQSAFMTSHVQLIKDVAENLAYYVLGLRSSCPVGLDNTTIGMLGQFHPRISQPQGVPNSPTSYPSLQTFRLPRCLEVSRGFLSLPRSSQRWRLSLRQVFSASIHDSRDGYGNTDNFVLGAKKVAQRHLVDVQHQNRQTTSIASVLCRRDLYSLWFATVAAASLTHVHDAAAASGALGVQQLNALAPVAGSDIKDVADAIRLPMQIEGGTFVVDFTVGKTQMKGVVDTGSPFITVEAECSKYWGCLKESDARMSGYDDTYEVYGMQEDGVTKWVLADIKFSGDGFWNRGIGPAPMQRRQSEGALYPWKAVTPRAETAIGKKNSSDNRVSVIAAAFDFPELVLGVISEVSVKGNAEPGPLVGLVKYRAKKYNTDYIRPTFLGQTDIVSFQLDFVNKTLLLSRRTLIPLGTSGVLKMIDLRPLGAPVFHYAVEVQKLWVNRQPFDADRPIYAVFDSGTTGMLVGRELFDSAGFDFGVSAADMRFESEDGNMVFVGASVRKCRDPCLFLCIPLDVPWAKNAHIIFVGLAALLNQGNMTVDIDSGRLLLGGYPGPFGKAEVS